MFLLFLLLFFFFLSSCCENLVSFRDEISKDLNIYLITKKKNKKKNKSNVSLV